MKGCVLPNTDEKKYRMCHSSLPHKITAKIGIKHVSDIWESSNDVQMYKKLGIFYQNKM